MTYDIDIIPWVIGGIGAVWFALYWLDRLVRPQKRHPVGNPMTSPAPPPRKDGNFWYSPGCARCQRGNSARDLRFCRACGAKVAKTVTPNSFIGKVMFASKDGCVVPQNAGAAPIGTCVGFQEDGKILCDIGRGCYMVFPPWIK